MEVSYSYRPNKKKTEKKRRTPRRATTPVKTRVVSIVALALGGGAFALLAALAWVARDLPDPNKLIARAIPLSTRIYDRTGEHVLYEVHGEKQRTLVRLDQIPNHLKWAALVAEDRTFYSHKGFSLKSMLRALVVDVLSGKKAQGGSTITQQFIKNALFTSKKSVTRKVKELILAYQIEQRFSKDQILQLYFNEIPYGSTAYGVASAASLYFGKNVSDLTLAESAILAALPKAPTYLSPWGNHREELIARAHGIIDSMVDEGYIEGLRGEDAKKEALVFKEAGKGIFAPHFVMTVRELLTEKYGEKMIEEGGLRVITTLDYDKQQTAEKAVADGGKKNLASNAHNAALVSLNTKTGEVLAMVGSRDYFDTSIDGNVNVTLRKRQPGSSFKPIVYAEAFSKGYTPRTIIFDLKTNFNTDPSQKDYVPNNYTGKEYGPVTMKQALAGSLNIAAVKTLYLAGVTNVIERARNMGYESLGDPGRYGLALVLGGAEVTLLEHTAAFSSFAQDGVVAHPTLIKKIEDKDGVVLEEFIEPRQTSAFDAQVARQITSILSDNAARAYIFGVKNHLVIPGKDVAVKTGTTNDYRDAWTIGYSKSVVTGVWVGNNNNTSMKKGADGSKLAAPIWNQYMRTVLAGLENEPFEKPEVVETGKAVLDGKIGEFESDPNASSTAPLLQEDIEAAPLKYHTILYYADKDNPRGPQPTNPQSDSQFLAWEKGVQTWAETHGEKTPLAPSLTINFPHENETIIGETLTAGISAQGFTGRAVQRVDYLLDDKGIASVTEAPFQLSYALSEKDNGFRKLTVQAIDQGGDIQTGFVTVNILFRKSPPSLIE